MGGTRRLGWTWLVPLVLGCNATATTGTALDGSGGSGGGDATRERGDSGGNADEDGSSPGSMDASSGAMGGTGGTTDATQSSTSEGGTGSGASGGAPATGGTSAMGGSGGSGGEANDASGGSGGEASESTTSASGGNGGATTDSGGSGGAMSTADSGGTGGSLTTEGLDMYLMVDKTSSMDNQDDVGGMTRWELVVDSLIGLTQNSDLNDVGVALQLFSYVSDADCNTANYTNPAVDMAPLSDNGGDVEFALLDAFPIGLTPTYPALEGAIQYAKDHKSENLTRAVVVVFITDGYPTECAPLDLGSVADLARASFEEAPSVPVHLIGLDGVLNLSQVAEAGGTEVYDVASGGDSAQMTAALLDIVDQYYDL